jgi:hypothetical protein
MKIKYKRPRYLKNDGPYIVELPFVQTSGRPGSAYEWVNGAHAAVHSLLAALMCDSKEGALQWLEQARAQIIDSRNAVCKRHARAFPVIATGEGK